MEYKIEVFYEYHPSYNNPCVALVRIALPCGTGDELVRELQSRFSVCEEVLACNWGDNSFERGYRVRTSSFSTRSFRLLEETVELYVTKTINLLNEVCETNRRNYGAIPENVKQTIEL